MDRSVSLGVFGAIHVDDAAKVTAELDRFRDDGDAIFIEYPTGTRLGVGDPSDILRYPLELLSYLLLTLVHGPFYLLFNRDLYSAEYLATARLSEDENIPLHAVDTPFLQLPRGPLTIAGNWLGLGLFVWLAPISVGVVVSALLVAGFGPALLRRVGRRLGVLAAAVVWTGAYAVIFWQFTLVAGVFVLVLIVTLFGRLNSAHEYRNEQMIARVESRVASEGYEQAVLMCGRAHVLGLVEQAREYGLEADRAHVSKFRSEGKTLAPVDLGGLRERGDVDLELPNPFARPDPNTRLVSPAPPQSVRSRRLAAGVVDLCISYLCAVAVSDVLWRQMGSVGAPESPGVKFLAGVVIVLAYHGVFEAIWATTPAKRLVGLFVTDRDGYRPALWQVLVRTLLRPLDYLVGFFLLAGTTRQRRLGDIAAGTLVGYDAGSDVTETRTPNLDTDLDRQVIVAGSDRRSVGSRIVAACVDIVPAFLFGTVLFALVLALLSVGFDGTLESETIGNNLVIAGVAYSMALYHPLSTVVFGQTLGQRVTSLRVAAPDGTVPEGGSLAVKYLLRPLDYGLVPLTLLTVLFTAQKQRPSELVAGTVVGRAKPDRSDDEPTATEQQTESTQTPAEQPSPDAGD